MAAAIATLRKIVTLAPPERQTGRSAPSEQLEGSRADLWASAIATEPELAHELQGDAVGSRVRILAARLTDTPDLRDALRLVERKLAEASARRAYRAAVEKVAGEGHRDVHPVWRAGAVEEADRGIHVRVPSRDEIAARVKWSSADPKRPGHPRRGEQRVLARRKELREKVLALPDSERECALGKRYGGKEIVEGHIRAYPELGESALREDWTVVRRELVGELTDLAVALEQGDRDRAQRERDRIARRNET